MNGEKKIEVPINQKIKSALEFLRRKDGLRRTQRWLSNKINMSEAIFSNKMNDDSSDKFSPEEIKKIEEVLGMRLD